MGARFGFHLFSMALPPWVPEVRGAATAVLKAVMAEADAEDLFNVPVDPEELGIPDYPAVVTKPMDLGTVKGRLSKGRYKSPLEFERDVEQTWFNAMLYNAKDDPVHTAAAALMHQWRTEWKKATGRDPSTAREEAAKAKDAAAKAAKEVVSPEGPEPPRQRKQVDLTLPGSHDKTGKKPGAAPDTQAAKLQAALRAIKATLREPAAVIFAEPVDPVELGIPDYFDIIKKPMDLGTIIKELERGRSAGWHALKYGSPTDVSQDVALVWKNCLTYNIEDQEIRGMCKASQAVFEREWVRAGLPVSDLERSHKRARAEEDDESDGDAGPTPSKKKKASGSAQHKEGGPPPPPVPPPPPSGKETAEQKLERKRLAAEEAAAEEQAAELRFEAAEAHFERIQKEHEKQRERDDAISRGDIRGGHPLTNRINGQPLVPAHFSVEPPTVAPALWRSGVFFFEQSKLLQERHGVVDPAVEALRLAGAAANGGGADVPITTRR